MVSELWGKKKYGNGKLFTIWFDGGIPEPTAGGPDLKKLVDKYINPSTNVFNGPAYTKNIVRWVGNETGNAPYPFYIPVNLTINDKGYFLPGSYHGNILGKSWVPGEADFPLREDHTWVQGGWFWNAKNQRTLSVPELLTKYFASVGANTNMLLGIVIDTSGQIPAQDISVLKAFGEALKQFDHPLGKASGSDTVRIRLNKKETINTLLIQEDISQGQRVSAYKIEALVQHQWQTVAKGQSIGHKRIQKIPSIATSAIRLVITHQVAKPIISNFSVYQVK